MEVGQKSLTSSGEGGSPEGQRRLSSRANLAESRWSLLEVDLAPDVVHVYVVDDKSAMIIL